MAMARVRGGEGIGEREGVVAIGERERRGQRRERGRGKDKP